jgi:hypothetical protein
MKNSMLEYYEKLAAALTTSAQFKTEYEKG